MILDLETGSPQDLLRAAILSLSTVAMCDEQGTEIPADFLTHIHRLRNALRRKCVGPDYSDEEFRRFFLGVLGFVQRDFGLRDTRVALFRDENSNTVQ